MTTKRKFSTLMLTGKAATLPMLISQQAQANITPSAQDLLNDKVTLIQLPLANQVQLKAVISAPDSAYGNGAEAQLCSGNLPQTLSVLVTGVRGGDVVYISASSDKGGNENIHPSILIGKTNLTLLAAVTVQGPANVVTTVRVPVDLSRLRESGMQLDAGGRFYIQAGAIPLTATGLTLDANAGRYSELDDVVVASCSAYGGAY